MSCDRNVKLAAAGSRTAGLPALGSKVSHTTGILLQKMNRASDRADQVADRVGQLTTPVTTALTRPKAAPALKKAAVSATTATVLSDGKPSGHRRILNTATRGGMMAAAALLPPARAGVRIVKTVDGISAAAGAVAAATTMTDEAGEVTREKRSLIFFKSTQRTSLWKSGLTNSINKRDVIGTLNKDNVLSSDGVMFETGGKAWHRGTSVVKMPSGKRTITHLQSLNVMAGHFYFDRELPDEQAVGVANGQINPETIAGYVGRITAAESLCPALANSKRLLLLARLHWPPQETKI
jgi:hypothetical protein